MARVKGGVPSINRHKKILELAKGYRGRGSKCYRVAIEKVEKALRYAYRDRRNKKRDFRRLWITRISAACRQNGYTYNRFIEGLGKAGIEIDRKVLSELAISDPNAFKLLADQAAGALAA